MVLTRESGLHDDALQGVVVQRLPTGETSAVAGRFDDEYRVRFVGVATFAFGSDNETVRADGAPTVDWETLEGLFETAVLPFVLQTRGYEALHASAVQMEGGVVGLCAHSGTGKTTAAFGLARMSGSPLWADDALVFRTSDGDSPYRCVALPFSPNLRPQSSEFFAEGGAPGRATHSTEEDLAALVVLERADSSSEARLERLGPADALVSILPHAYCFFVDDGREAAAVTTYTDLVARVPIYRLRFPGGFERLGSALNLLRRRLRDGDVAS